MARTDCVPGFTTLPVRLFIALAVLALPRIVLADGPVYTSEFHRELCTFTASGSNPYFPLWAGHAVLLEGEEDEGGETVEVSLLISVLDETELVDGVVTRVVEERESMDGELFEVARNYFATCRETGDVWYFGEDVDFYEGGVIVDHHGSWRAGIDGAEPGIQMPSVPLVGARYYQELAPGVALDLAEIASVSEAITLPTGSYTKVLKVTEGSAIETTSFGEKWYLRGIGLAKDGDLELVEVIEADCEPDATTLCLNDGRFRVEAEWENFAGQEGPGHAAQSSDDSGEFWFFQADNVELLVKIIEGCGSSLDAYWVFAAGLTNVGVQLTVTDTQSDVAPKVYDNEVGTNFAPILDSAAFATCP
ncbi:MAG: hypothetical protein ABIV06_14115 [Thermoanaerobaculia bacterium]